MIGCAYVKLMSRCNGDKIRANSLRMNLGISENPQNLPILGCAVPTEWKGEKGPWGSASSNKNPSLQHSPQMIMLLRYGG